jgi:UDP-glucose 4-epimerase
LLDKQGWRKTQIDQIFDAVEANRSKVTAALFVEHASGRERCLRFAAMALRYFNAAGADPQREIAEGIIQKLTSLLGWKPIRFSLETPIANA